MHFVQTEELCEKDRLALPIYNLNGGIALNADDELTNADIELLQKRGFSQVCILDDVTSVAEGTISVKTRAETIHALRSMNFDACVVYANRIASELLINDRGFITSNLMNLCVFDSYTFNHSVNVAVYAAALGIRLGLETPRVYDLAIAGLLHDLGKQMIPSNVMWKKGRFTDEERECIQSHPVVGFNMIKDNANLSKEIKYAVLTHHENFDGSGYPYNLVGTKIPIYGRILRIVDCYDALVSDRIYKKADTCVQALSYIRENSGTLFDKGIAEAFASNLATMSAGDEYIFEDGSIGYVKEIKSANVFTVVRALDGSEVEVTNG